MLQQRDDEAKAVLGNLDTYVLGQLQRVGLERRELSAESVKIPRQLRALLPRESATPLASGELPPIGFGLGGGVGAGKTMAMVALLKAHLSKRISRLAPKHGKVQADWVSWVSWPAFAGWVRSNAVADASAVQNRLQALGKVPLLFLDDLGAERLKGDDYTQDYARGELDLLVDRRYRDMLPTFFTTNLTQDGLVRIYGARMVRRLQAQAPLVELPVIHGENLQQS